MAQQIINTGEEPNDGTGEPLRSAFNAVNDNFTEIYTAGPVGSNVVISGNTISVKGTNNNLTLSANGIGNVQFNSTLTPTVNAVFDIGSANSQFRDVYASGYLYGNGRFLTGIAGGSGSGNSISNEATSVAIPTPGGNVVITIDGRGNVMVVQRQNVVVNANVVPGANVTYSLGTANAAWQDLYLSNSTIYLGNSTIQSNATSFTLTTVNGGSLVLQGNGTVVPYANANVAAFLPTNSANIRGGNISATGNVSGQFIIGDGGFLSNVVATGNVAVTQLGNGTSVLRVDGSGGNIISTVGGVSNVQIIAPTGVVVNGLISSTGNITGSNFFGNASTMSGLPEAYSNAKVALVLESYTGNITAGNVEVSGTTTTETLTAAGNITANSSISAQGNILTQGRISALGNIVTEGFFIGSFQGNVTGNLTVPGSNTQVIFNGDGNAAAAAGFTYNSDSNTVGVLGVVSAQGNVIAGNVVTAGRVSANSFTGNGAGLTSLSAANIVGTVPVAATVANATQPNITSVGTLTSLTVSGNISAPRIVVNNIGSDDSSILIIDDGLEVNGAIKTVGIDTQTVSATGNITADNFFGNGAALTSITGGNVVGTVATAVAVTDAAQPNITSVGALTSLTVTGVITGNTLTTNRIRSDDSSILIIDDGLKVDGILEADSLTTAGNVAANFFIGNGSLLTGGYSNTDVAAFLPTYTGNLAGLTGNVNTTGNVSANFFIGNGSLLTGVVATDIGTLSTLTVTGNTVSGNIQAQNTISGQNISITGNIVGTSGSNLDGIAIGLTTPESAKFTSVSATGNVTIDGITSTANITTNGVISASGQITAASINSIGNVFAGNINTAEIIATNIDAVSLDTSGNISATGNVTGSFFIGNGSLLTGVVSSYGDSNVQTYLPTYTGNLNSLQGNVTTTANVNANNVTITNALVTNSISTTGNAVIGGDLVVNGNTVQVNVTELNVEDPIIGVGRGANNAPLTVNDGKSRGVQLWYFNNAEQQAFVGWDTANSRLIAAANASVTNEVVSVNNYGTFVAGNISATSLTASGNIITGAGTGGNISGANVISANTVNAAAVNSTTVTTTGNIAAGGVLSVTGNITSSGVVSTAGNVVANTYFGSAAGLTFIPAGNIVGTVALAQTADVAATVTASNQPNITTVGLLTSLTVSGNLTVDTNTLIVREDTNNVGIGGTPTNKLTVVDNSEPVSQIQSPAVFYSSAITAGNSSIIAVGRDNVNTAGFGYIYAGNANANNSVVIGVGGITSLTINSANVATFAGNITTGTVLIDRNNAAISGLAEVSTTILSAAGNITGGNLRTNGAVSAAGNIEGNNLSVTNTIQTNNISVTANVVGGNLISTANISATNTVSANVITAPLITSAGNITAVGNVVAANFVGNLVGNLSSPGSNTQVLFNNNGTIGADSGFVFDSVANELTVAGNISTNSGGSLNVAGSVSVTGNITMGVGNINGSNIRGTLLSVSGNVIGGNIISGGELSVTANINSGSINASGLVSATGNVISNQNVSGANLISSGAISAAGSLSVAGTATVGNVNSSGTIESTGNILGGNINTLGNVAGGNVVVTGVVTSTGNIVTAGNFVGTLVGNVIGNISLPGSNSQVLFNNDGIIGASSGLTYNISTNLLSVTGAISSTGNVEAANLVTSGNASVTGNVAANNISATTISLSGNVLSAINSTNNIVTSANITANNIAATTAINIAGNQVATVDDATALAIALG
jgi:hypothetical protein